MPRPPSPSPAVRNAKANDAAANGNNGADAFRRLPESAPVPAWALVSIPALPNCWQAGLVIAGMRLHQGCIHGCFLAIRSAAAAVIVARMTVPCSRFPTKSPAHIFMRRARWKPMGATSSGRLLHGRQRRSGGGLAAPYRSVLPRRTISCARISAPAPRRERHASSHTRLITYAVRWKVRLPDDNLLKRTQQSNFSTQYLCWRD